MTIEDIINANFIENSTLFSPLDMIVGLLLALLIGTFIFLIYKKTYKGVMYSSGFAVSLIGLTLITTFVILAVTSNVVLSLSMLGALSIVRFRTAIKEPLDIVFLFWAIVSGIVIGAGIIPLAVFGSLFIGIVLLIFVNKKPISTPYILIINCNDDYAEAQAIKIVSESTKRYDVKAKTASSGNGIELTLEVRFDEAAVSFINEISAIDGVTNVAMVSYNGDYMT